jgi:hypothetical protein
LLPLIGWRGMFGLGVVPAIATYVIRASLHEPEVFVAKSKDHPKEFALHLLVKDGETAKLSLGLVILSSVAEFWLLRRDDLAAELSLEPASASP